MADLLPGCTCRDNQRRNGHHSKRCPARISYEQLRDAATVTCTEPSEDLDWECVKASNLDALRDLLGIEHD